MYIDSHAHISKPDLMPHIDQMLARAKDAGIDAIVNICTDQPSLQYGLELANKYPWVYNAAATPPHDVLEDGEKMFPVMAQHARQGDLVAVGETGLDYFYHTETKELQHHFLRKYLQLALECKLPVVIHCRDAFADFFQILDEEYQVNGRHAPGVLHCFTGTVAEAEEVLKRGWYLSLSGIVTFKKSETLREVAKMVPLNQLLIETDTPFLAPQSKRGKANEPAFLAETAQFIADQKLISLQELAAATSANAKQFYKI
jgi:TatD DNase family protein